MIDGRQGASSVSALGTAPQAERIGEVLGGTGYLLEFGWGPRCSGKRDPPGPLYPRSCVAI